MRPAACLPLSLSLLCSVTGCHTWTRQPQPVSTPPAFRQYQVWTRDSVMIMHGVRVEHDTLHGIPVSASRDCGSCTLSIPMTNVDSVRAGTTEHVGTAVLGVAAGAGALFLLIAYLYSLGTGN